MIWDKNSGGRLWYRETSCYLPVVHFKVRSCWRLIDAPIIPLPAGKNKPLILSVCQRLTAMTFLF